MDYATDETLNDFRGTIYRPQDDGYDEARLPWHRNSDPRPAIVFEPANATDVQAIMTYAEANDLGVAVQSTGHGTLTSQDGGILIRTSKLNTIEVDEAAQTVRAGAGAIWADILAKTDPHNLAPITGTYPYVGVAGYTLGGGLGWLSRQYGLAAQSLVSVEVVTVNGELKHVSEHDDPELFWGLKGGSGNFGVVTSLEFRVYPMNMVYAGHSYYEVAQAGEILRTFRDWSPTLPDEFTMILTIMQMPPIDALPEPLRGKKVVDVGIVYDGDEAEAAELLKPFYDRVGQPFMPGFKEQHYIEFMKLMPELPPGKSLGMGGLYAELSDETIELIEGRIGADEPVFPVIEVRQAGGAMASIDGAGAASYAEAKFVLGMHLSTGRVEAGAVAAVEGRFHDLSAQLLKAALPLTALNIIEDVKDTERSFTPDAYHRLQALKAKYDPNNRLQYGYHIEPEA